MKTRLLCTHLLLVVLVVCTAPLVLAQEGQGRCSWMTAIPREPKPDDMPSIDSSGGWSVRPFIPADEEREDVCLDQYTSGTQVILMDEENEDAVPIAKINYQGTQTPYVVTPLLSGSYAMLGPEIRQENGEWFLYITERQDYETPGMQLYMFYVRIEGESFTATVSLRIVNIDDNDPIIIVQNTCQVPELGEPRLTDCMYEVHDADGQISTAFMRFVVTSDRDDDKIFTMHGTNREDTWFIMDMTVGINEPLDFMNNALHVFQVTAYDSADNFHTVTLMVQVENVEHRSPRWVEIFAVQQFDEKTEQQFPVRAIDGDTGINNPIHYKLETNPEDEEFFSIETLPGGYSGGILSVAKIDRDELERELFQFKIIAYKPNNESLYTESEVAIIINDVNDQAPEPLATEYTVSILEETPLTLDFDKEFGFHDRDLGANAQYQVRLESVYPEGAHNAFYIAPEIGYQRQTFVMGTVNHSMLDYEVPEFQKIQLLAIATDLGRPDLQGVAIVNINLINWNDEEPIFDQAILTVTFKETEGEGFHVTNMLATDRDIGDKVQHSLMGNAIEYLRIDVDNGDIFVSKNDSFDYHRQNQLFIQVRADDTLMEPYHSTTTQLVIQLEDVNNTPPTLQLPRGNPQVEENVPQGYVIADGEHHTIRATDPDTTAELKFEINWETSYATKQGRETDPKEFLGCVDIETQFPNEGSTGTAIGILAVKEIRENVTIDYEMFEMLYLSVRVVDLKTEIGTNYDELTLSITIIDMNDNRPEWVEGTLTQQFRVREVSATDTIIGSVTAIDADGPLYNKVSYTIVPRVDTPANLVKIDSQTGQISVDLDQRIDADVPPRLRLYYTVIASDKCLEPVEQCPPDPTFWETPGEITIEIIDTNNKVPTPEYEATVYIYENATTGDDVVLLHSTDLDRDEIYHKVSYQINYQVNTRLRDFFEVDLDTGRVFVNYVTDAVLDRDGDERTHRIFLQLFDNFLRQGDGNTNQVDIEVLVILLDVNDNAPELPSPQELFWSISEGLLADTPILPDIYAPDRDEPGTDNSRVGYAILDVTITNRDLIVPDLFKMTQFTNLTGDMGRLETALDLKGYWGTYNILIEAFDHGVPQQNSTETYTLVINPYNFHAPQFIFPESETTVRLAREWAVANVILRKVNNENLESITATDEDGLEAGVVTFEIAGDAEAVQYFKVINNGNNIGVLQLNQDITDRTEFNVNIRATDHGTEPGPLFTDVILHVVFVPTTGSPVFEQDMTTVSFFEKEAGLTQIFDLPKATDPKNYLCTDDCHNVFYSIFDGNENGYFKLDATTNTLSLVVMLDREESITHQLTVVASNSLQTAAPVTGATLTVVVNVREADPKPQFERDLYTAGISTADSIARELLTLHATHSENDAITYTIDEDSMLVDPTLEAVKDFAFILNPQTGLLVLNVQPTAAMHGMFEFSVTATDTAGKTDEAEVKVYVVSALNWVYFIFQNTVTQIEAKRNIIAQTFTASFEMTCNIDQVTPYTDASGIASDSSTRLRAHFIKDDVPVTADVVEEIRMDTQRILAIRQLLLAEELVLYDLFTEESPEVIVTLDSTMVYVLAGLSGLLALMVILLLVTYVVRVRMLNNRLESLTTNKYGSIDSGLNRAGLVAPGTNKHAVEGSNPIWNEAIKAPNFDALSECSGDSDLIGIEDLPQFRHDYFPPEDTDSTQDVIGNSFADTTSSSSHIIPNHSNSFGYPSDSSFKPQFSSFMSRQ